MAAYVFSYVIPSPCSWLASPPARIAAAIQVHAADRECRCPGRQTRYRSRLRQYGRGRVAAQASASFRVPQVNGSLPEAAGVRPEWHLCWFAASGVKSVAGCNRTRPPAPGQSIRAKPKPPPRRPLPQWNRLLDGWTPARD